MRSPSRLIIFQRCSALSLPFMALFRLLGFAVRYLSISPAMKAREPRLMRHGLSPLDFDECVDFKYATFDSDPDRLVQKAMTALLPDDRLYALFAPLFPGVRSFDEKIRVCLYQAVAARCFLALKAHSWLHGMFDAKGTVWLVMDRNPFAAHVLNSGRFRAVNLAPPGLSAFCALWPVVRGIALSAAARARRAFRQNAPSGPATPPQPRDAFDPARAKVLFFPHDSLFYGRLFARDHFYVEDPSSPLHIGNVLHVFLKTKPYDPNLPEEVLRRHNKSVHEVILPGIRPKCILRRLAALLSHCFANPASLRACLGRSRQYACALLCEQFLSYSHYTEQLARFSSAKVALVGYDILFPTSLSLALEARGVKTVASQERFIATFYPFSFILDTYCCASPFAANHIANAYTMAVARAVAVGMVRTDLLHQYKEEHSFRPPEGKPLAVILNFHTLRDPVEAAATGIISWKAHRHFHEEMLELARAYPGIHFVIRGKNDHWLDIPFFKDIADAIAELDNIEVNRDYSSLNVSYRLCSQASVIVAKHTSLADECMAFGLPVLCHDYQPNATSTIADAAGDLLRCVFCRSRDDFFERFAAIVASGFAQPEDQKRASLLLHGDLCDALVRKRIRKHVLGLLGDDA